MNTPRRWRLGLRERLVAAVLGVLTALLAITAALVVMRSELALVEAQQTRFAALTRQLADSLRYAVLAQSPALMEPSLDVFARSPDLVQVEVRDERRALLAVKSGPQGPVGDGVERSDVVTVEVPVNTREQAPGDEDDELAIFGLGSEGTRLVGYVQAVFSTEATARIQDRLRREILAAFTILGGLGLLAVFGLASSVVRRTRFLAQAAARVAEGDLGVRVEDPASDELAALAQDFNAMTTALAEQHVALDQAASQLAEQEALSAIGRATAVIAHELKNPLGILLGAAQIAANDERPETARRKAAGIIVEEVQRLERTLNELLHYARPRPASRMPVDVLELCRRSVQRVRSPGGPAEGASIDVSGESCTVLADEQQLAQILLNLLTNAAQAGAKHIAIAVQRAASRVRVEVQDDGPGIAPSVQDQLFRPFVTTKQRGAGLGLAGSRRMARENAGDLRHEPGEQGARFVLELEMAAPGSPPRPSEPHTEASEPGLDTAGAAHERPDKKEVQG
ncbi:MAG: ATP-binding protein [Pseudomonadota bacterium]